MHRSARHVLGALGAVALCIAAPFAAANLGDIDEGSSDNANFQEGKKAIEAQDWNMAIALLGKAAEAEPKNADIQNFLGYASRKAGNLDAALKYYGQALQLNPRHKPAHEYMGEAYLLANNLQKAEEHLAELQKLCTPIPCEEYKELKRAVDEYKKSRK